MVLRKSYWDRWTHHIVSSAMLLFCSTNSQFTTNKRMFSNRCLCLICICKRGSQNYVQLKEALSSKRSKNDWKYEYYFKKIYQKMNWLKNLRRLTIFWIIVFFGIGMKSIKIVSLQSDIDANILSVDTYSRLNVAFA